MRYGNKIKLRYVLNAICDINEIQPKTLTQTQMSILMVILSYVDSKTGEASISQTKIRQCAGIASDTTYYKAFNQLVDKGWIIQRKRFNDTACYRIVIPDDIWELLTSSKKK